MTLLEAARGAEPWTSAELEDWTRERCKALSWDPARQMLRALRDYQRLSGSGGRQDRLLSKLAVLRHRFWSLLAGADLPLNCRVGGGLLIPHPNGIVVHPDARIGKNCLLFQQVTIGTGRLPGVPTLGGHVEVGAGAKLLGGIKIGDHAVIGANAVVLADVPARAFVAGVPARIKR
jgi:serine O-acetyltransferase